ncbi:MAG: hypothetical protein HYU67_14020 [Flavobacteriia bacterium]|nr:hypothetical protein [Flavobacteriia bacterium]
MNSFDLEKSELLEQAFQFWFNGQEHIRSPFPAYIQSELKVLATEKFEQWLKNLNEEAKDEVVDEIIAEKFEEILFEQAHQLVLTEDERLTILYPFLPRLGDQLKDDQGVESEIVDRMLHNDKDERFLEIVCKRLEEGTKWTTRFELPI